MTRPAHVRSADHRETRRAPSHHGERARAPHGPSPGCPWTRPRHSGLQSAARLCRTPVSCQSAYGCWAQTNLSGAHAKPSLGLRRARQGFSWGCGTHWRPQQQACRAVATLEGGLVTCPGHTDCPPSPRPRLLPSVPRQHQPTGSPHHCMHSPGQWI